GLSTAEIARAFLVPEPTIAQRLVRAKRTIRDRELPYQVPEGEELAERLPAVLAVIYLVFNEGYAAHTGDALVRHDLCDEALRLGRILAELMPEEPEVLGLAALDAVDASALRSYHLLPAARADFLRRLERWAEAAAEYRRALTLTDNASEQKFLAARLAACEQHLR